MIRMAFVLQLCLVQLLVCLCTMAYQHLPQDVNAQGEHKTDDYFWRDYDGRIPIDALVAGSDKNGQSVYVGQALFESKLIPGKIVANDNKVYFEWHGVQLSTPQNVKILCTHHVKNLNWVQTNVTELIATKDGKLIIGGFEANLVTYIGKAERDGETEVGKIICSERECLGLYTASGVRTRQYNSFQVLNKVGDFNRDGLNKYFTDCGVIIGKSLLALLASTAFPAFVLRTIDS